MAVKQPEKSFKQMVAEKELAKKEVKVAAPKKPVVQVAETIIPPKKTSEFSKEVIRTQLKEEVEKEIRVKIEEEVKTRLQEEYSSNVSKMKIEFDTTILNLREEYEGNLVKMREELEGSVLKRYTDVFVENNKIMASTMDKLVEKISSLQDSLKIEIPTPIVQLTMPDRNVIKKVHRDGSGNITHVSEEIADKE